MRTAFRAALAATFLGFSAAVARPQAESEPPAPNEHADAKRVLLEKINAERRVEGLRPVAWDPLGARVGDAFCRDAATRRFAGHFDLEGRGPHLRWGLAGGVDWHAENAASESRTGYTFTESVEKLLLRAHARFMAERPPADGHRRLVLNPNVTHVGIGVHVEPNEFRMTEEFSRRVAEAVVAPREPLRPGARAPFAFRLPRGWTVASVSVAWEPGPRPITAREAESRLSYAYPKEVASYRPKLGAGFRWADGETGSFEMTKRNEASLSIPLDKGRGDYYVLVYAGEGDLSGRAVTPITGTLVRAE